MNVKKQKQIKMRRTEQDYLNLLKETVEYYLTDGVNRALDSEGDCKYYTKGDMCAVGRCLVNPKDKDNILGGTSDVDSLLNRFSDNIFKKQYRGYSLNFWSKLQRLHDGEGYWVDGKLSHSGEAKEKDINQWIINNIPY